MRDPSGSNKPRKSAITDAEKHVFFSKKAPSEDQKLMRNLGLSETEFLRYKQLHSLKQTEISALLNERKLLSYFVKQHLEEKINTNKKMTALLQFLFPSEHSLRYALKKVDDIEQEINQHLNRDAPLFDKSTTKQNRLEILLSVASTYQDTLLKTLSHSEDPALIQQKLINIQLLINEFKQQLHLKDFNIHNKDIRAIKDPELNYFLRKLKAIGITGLTPKPYNKEHSFFKVNIISALLDRIYPSDESEDKKESDDSPRL